MIRRIGRVSGYAYQHPMCSCMHAGAPNACASSCARAQTGVHAATCHAHQIERLIRPINCRFLHEAVFSKYLVTSSRNVKNHSILNFSSYFRFLYNGPYCFGYPQIQFFIPCPLWHVLLVAKKTSLFCVPKFEREIGQLFLCDWKKTEMDWQI